MNFYGRKLPEDGRVAGYGWLIDQLKLPIPLPQCLALVARHHRRFSTADWQVFRSQQWPGDTVFDHLIFAIKNEGFDLRVLERVTQVVESTEIAEIERRLYGSTGIFARRLWFVWEWLTGQLLDIPDLGKVKYIPVLEADKYFALVEGEKSPRHKVINTFPGLRSFCPLIRRSAALERALAMGLAGRALAEVDRAPGHIIGRAAAFLLLDDSKASFEIEQEQAGPQRAARWARAISEAGQNDLSVAELGRLQQIVLQDQRFLKMGIRKEGGFIGRHDRQTQRPEPVHISARPEDLGDLLQGLAAYEARALGGGIDPIVVAAALAFGFVYIHPFEDGNGRIHRYLFHHVLARGGFNPPGIIFPVSAVILRRINDYEAVLKSVSAPMLEHISWAPTAKGNVEVTGETAHLYRYFDATVHAEFFADCVKDTIELDLPREIAYLVSFDQFKSAVEARLDMPANLVELLKTFLQQNGGRLSARARKREFQALTGDEIEAIERAYAMAWPEDQTALATPQL
ncbi:MAG: Fic family protein [Rhodobacteraceae bacterium]|nr:Fic family protein [Paracoccaceae bacterium]